MEPIVDEAQPTNVFPLHLIKVSEGEEVMVELRSGQSYHGKLSGVDKFMNLRLEDAVITSADGLSFHKVKDVCLRGNTIRSLCLPNESITKIESTKYVSPEAWKKTHAREDKGDKVKNSKPENRPIRDKSKSNKPPPK